MICVTIIYKLAKKISYYLVLKFWDFIYIYLYKALFLKAINLIWKWPWPSGPLTDVWDLFYEPTDCSPLYVNAIRWGFIHILSLFICNVELNACFSCLYARVRIMLIRSTIAFFNLFCNLGCLVLMLCDSNLMSDETLACQIDIFTLLCIRSVLDHYKCIFTCIIKDLATIKDVFHLQKVFL